MTRGIFVDRIVCGGYACSCNPDLLARWLQACNDSFSEDAGFVLLQFWEGGGDLSCNRINANTDYRGRLGLVTVTVPLLDGEVRPLSVSLRWWCPRVAPRVVWVGVCVV